MMNLRKAIQIALYGSVFVAGSVSAAVDVVQNGGAEAPPPPAGAPCSLNPTYWDVDGAEGGQRRQYVPGDCTGAPTNAGAPSWVDMTPPFEGEDWMFYTGPENSPGGTGVSTISQYIHIPEFVGPATDSGLCIDSIFPDLTQGFRVGGWFSTRCHDGIEGAAGFGDCVTGDEPYGTVSVAANGIPLCESEDLQSTRGIRIPPPWEMLDPTACADGLEGGLGDKHYKLTLQGTVPPGPPVNRPSVVWDNMSLGIQCTGAAVAMGGRSEDPEKPGNGRGKKKPVRTYGGRAWAEWDGNGHFGVMGEFTIAYHKTADGMYRLRDTCHLEVDENTELHVEEGQATFIGLNMWCNHSDCADEDVGLVLSESPDRGRVSLSGLDGSCTDPAGNNHEFAGSQGDLDAGNVTVEGYGWYPVDLDTD